MLNPCGFTMGEEIGDDLWIAFGHWGDFQTHTLQADVCYDGCALQINKSN